MIAGRPSRTSEGNTAVRAREMRKPAADRICSDPFAPHFLSPFFLQLRRHPLIGKAYGWLVDRRCPGLRGGILARTRYIDERTTACLGKGIEQLIVLGAGNDSRGYRLVEPGGGVRVFEVDHPATQAAKREKVMELFGGIPAHVTFVPVDFCRDDLRSRLREAGYDRDRKSLFIWEGVIYYLTAAAVDDTLNFVAHCSGDGSSIIFDYFPLSVIDGTCKRKESINMRRRVARMGEPFLFGIRDEEIGQFLRERGFQHLEIIDSSACKDAWFHGVNEAVKVTDIFRFVHATHY
ncbi:MAG: class I SAM-dependent methyltransferase [Desulfuromonadales bacterium]|nr:MAG: class I SAM-dependent methyltransferase [Desulfuromonadales bacterium]